MKNSTDLLQWEYRKLVDLHYQVRRFLRLSEEAAREEGLEAQQHQFLVAIRGHPGETGPTVGDLADCLLIRHHSAVGLADRLTARGLVRRVADERDRRQVRVQLTEAGVELLKRLGWVHREELRYFGPQLLEALQQSVTTYEPAAPAGRCTIEERA